MTRKKKKFFDTTVGRVLKGAASIVAPGLVGVLEDVQSVGEAVQKIKESTEIDDDTKIRLQEMALDQYEAEVADRVSARQREAAVAMSGGNDVMFKVVGAGVMGIWVFLLYALFFGDLTFNDSIEDLMQIAFGAVSSQMMAVVSYYFGASKPTK